MKYEKNRLTSKFLCRDLKENLENLALCCLLYEPHSNLPFKFCSSQLDSSCPTSQNNLRLAALSEKPKKLTIEIQHAAWFFLAIAGFFLSRVGYSVGIDGVDEDFVCELAHK